jgi:hypothetical protein
MFEHQTEFEIFLELAEMLNSIGSMPVFYGSLALSQLVKDPIEVDDIDILVEDKLFSTKLSDIHELMRLKGFVLVNTEENEFERNSYRIGIASDRDFERFSGTDLSELEHCLHSGVRFRKLNLHQFPGVYRASLLDGYRNKKRGIKDSEKVALIKKSITAANMRVYFLLSLYMKNSETISTDLTWMINRFPRL